MGRPKKYLTEEARIKANKDRVKEWRKNNPEKFKLAIKRQKLNNPDRFKKATKKWQDKNKDTIKEKRKLRKNKEKNTYNIWKNKNIEHFRKVRREGEVRRKKDPIYKLKCTIRSSISNSFKRNNKNFKKRLKCEEILGCSLSFFVEYILSQCPKGITINDFHKFGYHLDHIIPVSSATNEEEILKLNHFSNFQPLFWKDNLEKSNN